MIESIRREHSEIIDKLNKIKKIGINSKEGGDELLSLKDFILNHVRNEEKEFYPEIRKEAKHNKKLEEVLNEFDKDMDRILQYSLGFFDGYCTSNRSNMPIVVETFIEVLRRRILREDSILIPLFKKLHKKST
jgi:hypothetical protein